MNENNRTTLNRIVAFVAGGFLVFLVMNFSVLTSAKTEIAELKVQLDASLYESGKLLENATAQLVAREYRKAKDTLNNLFDRHPGSAEAAAGRTLYESIVAAEKKADERWEGAVIGVQKKWEGETAAKLRAKFEQDMDYTLTREWDNVKDRVRTDWESN